MLFTYMSLFLLHEITTDLKLLLVVHRCFLIAISLNTFIHFGDTSCVSIVLQRYTTLSGIDSVSSNEVKIIKVSEFTRILIISLVIHLVNLLIFVIFILKIQNRTLGYQSWNFFPRMKSEKWKIFPLISMVKIFIFHFPRDEVSWLIPCTQSRTV